MAKFNVDKAKAAGMTDEAIQSYLSQHPELEPKGNFTGNLMEDIKNNAGQVMKDTLRDAAPTVERVGKNIGKGAADLLHLPETGNTRSTVANFAIGLPRAMVELNAEAPAKFLADNVTPTGLAVNALTLGAGEVAPPLLKGGSKVLGKVLSGKNARTIGKLFDEPTAMISGAKEMVTKGAQKAFGAAKELTGIRQVKRGAEALDSAKDAVKKVFDVREAVAARAKELVKAGAEKGKALKYAVEELKLPEATLEARQGIDAMSGKIMETPAGNALRNRFNASLKKIAPLIREADPAVAKAALGKEFLQLMPEGFGRRVIATAGLGGSVLNPGLIAPTVAFSPFATGVGTSLAGGASQAIQALTKSQLRRSLISALASRMNDNQEGK